VPSLIVINARGASLQGVEATSVKPAEAVGGETKLSKLRARLLNRRPLGHCGRS